MFCDMIIAMIDVLRQPPLHLRLLALFPPSDEEHRYLPAQKVWG